MEHILDETVPSADLKKFEQKYHEELQAGKVSTPVLIVVLTIPYKLENKGAYWTYRRTSWQSNVHVARRRPKVAIQHYCKSMGE